MQKEQYTLLDILVSFYNKIANWIEYFSELISFGFKKAPIFGSILLIFNLFGFIYYKLSKPYYVSEATIEFRSINSSDILPYIDNINYTQSKSLAALFETDSSVLKSFVKIEGYFLIDVNRDFIGDYVDYKNVTKLTDTTKRRIPNKMVLKVWSYKPSFIAEFNTLFKNYINKNEFVEHQNIIRISNLDSSIRNTKNEIFKLDKYQQKEYFEYRGSPQKGNQENIYLQEQSNNNLFHKELIILVERNNQLNSQKSMLNTVDFIVPFYVPSEPENTLISILIRVNKYGIFLLFIVLVLLYRKTIAQNKA